MLQLPVPPQPLDDLPVHLQLPEPVLLSVLPAPLEHLPFREVENPLAVFQTLSVFPFVPISIGPAEHSFAFNDPILPVTSVSAVINISECPAPVKLSIFELAFINARIRNISSNALFNPVKKFSLIIAPV